MSSMKTLHTIEKLLGEDGFAADQDVRMKKTPKDLQESMLAMAVQIFEKKENGTKLPDAVRI